MKTFCVELVSCLLILLESTTKAEGSIQFYADSDCTELEADPVSLLAGTCQAGNQAVAVEALALPNCTTGYGVFRSPSL
jgi:hypothetical protein